MCLVLMRGKLTSIRLEWSSLFQITITDEVVRINLPKEIILDVEVIAHSR